MGIEQEGNHQSEFTFEGRSQKINFVETLQVREGVQCEVFAFNGDATKDLGIIRIEPGFKTPLQKVLQGTRTIEGYISGEGQLTVTRRDGCVEVYQVNDSRQDKPSVDVNIGDLMQWEATGSERLNAFEICIPSYQDGRYENLD